MLEHVARRLEGVQWNAKLLDWAVRARGSRRLIGKCRPCAEGLDVSFRCGQGCRSGHLFVTQHRCASCLQTAAVQPPIMTCAGQPKACPTPTQSACLCNMQDRPMLLP